MELEMLNASVVVLSEGNNPKLLNHDFLARNKLCLKIGLSGYCYHSSVFKHGI